MATPDQNTDRLLLERISSGDEIAFRILFEEYRHRVYSLAAKMTHSQLAAEEIVQDVFLIIWQKRELLSQVDNTSAYFFTIVYRRIYQYFRKLAVDKKVALAFESDEEYTNITEETVYFREQEKLINEAVSKLPSKMQLVFKLGKQEGLRRQEIANRLNISPNTVRNLLYSAVKAVRAHLDNLASALIFFILLFS